MNAIKIYRHAIWAYFSRSLNTCNSSTNSLQQFFFPLLSHGNPFPLSSPSTLLSPSDSSMAWWKCKLLHVVHGFWALFFVACCVLCAVCWRDVCWIVDCLLVLWADSGGMLQARSCWGVLRASGWRGCCLWLS